MPPTMDDRQCATCGHTEEMAHLECCVVCGKWFCSDCSYKAMGRRFCSQPCSVQYYYGEIDDDEDDLTADE
jgi:hypothetical protein